VVSRLARIAATAVAVVAGAGCRSSDDARAPSTVDHSVTEAATVDTSAYCGPSEPCVQPGWYPVSGASMEPTLHCTGAKVCGRRFNRNRVKTADLTAPPARFDLVVVAHRPRSCWFDGPLRIIGLPGEVWEERDGFVYIDGKKLAEPYVRSDRRDRRTLSLKDIRPRGTMRRIPPHMYLLMGDNRAHACDSRSEGLAVQKRGAMVKVILIADYTGKPTGLPPRGY
jgi:signal peptidase I